METPVSHQPNKLETRNVLMNYLVDNPETIIPVLKYYLNIKMKIEDTVRLTEIHKATNIDFPFDGDKRRETSKASLIKRLKNSLPHHK